MVTDLGALAGAIADAGGGANIMVFANPRQATVIQLRAPTFSVVPTAALPARNFVAVEVGGVATGSLGVPEVSTSNATTLPLDTTPADIGVPGSPNTVSAPT